MTTMTHTQAAEILEAHNAWRRQSSDEKPSLPMQDPKAVGQAIELAVNALRAHAEAKPAPAEPVAWMIDWPDEPELGHYFSTGPIEPAVGRSVPLYAAPAAPADFDAWVRDNRLGDWQFVRGATGTFGTPFERWAEMAYMAGKAAAPAARAPAAPPAPVVTQAAPTDEPATLMLGTICDRLGFTISAAFLADTLHIKPVKAKGASKLYTELQFARICQQLQRHISSMGSQGRRETLRECADGLHMPADLLRKVDHVAPAQLTEGERTELDRLRALVNTPEIHDFSRAVVLEAAHQRERWGAAGDAGKSPQDWFWLLGYLGGKALAAHAAGNTGKALHHTISSAAALANWHAAISGADAAMRPGIDPVERGIEAASKGGAA